MASIAEAMIRDSMIYVVARMLRGARTKHVREALAELDGVLTEASETADASAVLSALRSALAEVLEALDSTIAEVAAAG